MEGQQQLIITSVDDIDNQQRPIHLNTKAKVIQREYLNWETIKNEKFDILERTNNAGY